MAKLDWGRWLSLFSLGSDRRKSPGILVWRCQAPLCQMVGSKEIVITWQLVGNGDSFAQVFKGHKKALWSGAIHREPGATSCTAATVPAGCSGLPCCLLPACYTSFGSSSWPCGNLLLLLRCWQMHFVSTTSVLRRDPSPSPLREPEMFARAAGSHSVAPETWKPKTDFAFPPRGSPIRIQHPYLLRCNLL